MQELRFLRYSLCYIHNCPLKGGERGNQVLSLKRHYQLQKHRATESQPAKSHVIHTPLSPLGFVGGTNKLS